ncbi:amidase [Neobacillus cucumis]|uniref:amidase n=1 Tax=Neobacillus cucumis TaxID=1740721 RepID=UPI0028531FFA|nr:amidase [Neobacillus cucumis]MDR4948077.1 amidase [Neobacillus cucumis]
MSKTLAQMSISELSPMLRDQEVSPVEITESIFNRIKAFDKEINSYVEVNEEKAIESAKRAEREISNGEYKGALHGIPMALKDILHFKGETSALGSKIHKDFIAEDDAAVVSKLKEAGVVFTGKLNMHEYAWGGTTNNPHFGPTRNPWNLSKIPGGSSGGSGAAVAADLTIASLGTDTGGSIRMPAAACGIVGLKPTHGRVSKSGCFPLSWSLDHIGPMTKTVEDAAILLEYIAGYDKNDPTTVSIPVDRYSSYLTGDIKGKVIGIEEDYFFHNVGESIELLVRKAIDQMEAMGAKVEIVKIPTLKYAQFAEMMTCYAEGGTIHSRNIRERPEDFGEDTRIDIKLAQAISSTDYLQAQQVRNMMKREFAEIFEQVDVLVAPMLPIMPPDIGDTSANTLGLYSCPANLTGLPAISLPCGMSEGLPVGMQIIGPAFEERKVLNFAYAFEKTNPLNGMKPFQFELNRSL